jgi:hypothetical protein
MGGLSALTFPLERTGEIIASSGSAEELPSAVAATDITAFDRMPAGRKCILAAAA